MLPPLCGEAGEQPAVLLPGHLVLPGRVSHGILFTAKIRDSKPGEQVGWQEEMIGVALESRQRRA